MHKRANELRDKIGYQAEDAKNSIEERSIVPGILKKKKKNKLLI